MGRPVGVRGGGPLPGHQADAGVDVVDGALASLRARFDVVVCEGAGSPAEINLLSDDIVNLGLARRAGIPAIVVGRHRAGRGLRPPLRDRGHPPRRSCRSLDREDSSSTASGVTAALLGGATAELEDRCGIPTFGVLPHLGPLELDAEDSLALGAPPARRRPVPPASTWRPSACPASPTSPTSTRSWPSRACASVGSTSPARWATPTWSSSAGTRATRGRPALAARHRSRRGAGGRCERRLAAPRDPRHLRRVPDAGA